MRCATTLTPVWTGLLEGYPSGNPFPTQSSTITLHLPEPATFTNYGIYGADAEAEFQPGQRDATIRIADSIAGQEVGSRSRVAARHRRRTPAPWQAELDQAAERAARRSNSARSGAPCSTWVHVPRRPARHRRPVLLYIWWYRRGRDKPVGLVADYLPEPPSDLPPGMVGTMLDERIWKTSCPRCSIRRGAACWKSKRKRSPASWASAAPRTSSIGASPTTWRCAAMKPCS